MNNVPGLGYDKGDTVTVYAHDATYQGPVPTDIGDTAHRPAMDSTVAIGGVDMVRVVALTLPMRVVGVPAVMFAAGMPARLPAMAAIIVTLRMPVFAVAASGVAAIMALAVSAIPIRVAVLLAALLMLPRAAGLIRVLGQHVSCAEATDDSDRGACQDDLAKPFHQLFLQSVSGSAV